MVLQIFFQQFDEDPALQKCILHPGEELCGFDRFQAETILAATKLDGELMFLIKWQGSDQRDLVSAGEANVKCPQVVIQFYEKNTNWRKGSQGEDKGWVTKKL